MAEKLTGVQSEGGKLVNALFDDSEFDDVYGNLIHRWSDEGEYEDINDYKKVLDPIVKRLGLTIDKMTKRPFGFQVVHGGMRYQVNTRGWRRIA